VKPPLVIIVVFLGMTACGQAAGPPAPLQKYDSLGRQLREITRSSETVAVDVQQMNAAIQREQLGASRRQAVILKSDGAFFCRQAGLAESAVRRLATRESQWRVRYYFSLIVHALAWQWQECRDLRRLSDIVWADPLASTAQSGARLIYISGQSRSAAFLAQRFARRASGWRRQYASDFRYSAVR
jgi:hypothetical protein